MLKQPTKNLVKILKSGGIGVLATDTIYGLVGPALVPDTIERIYQVRKRTPTKPLIILLGQEKNLDLFGVKLSPGQRSLLATLWPGPVSIILPLKKAALKHFKYLHRGTGTLAFRLPYPKALRTLLLATGPLVAPSANPEGLPPAQTIKQARVYFGGQVDFYQAGPVKNQPSTLISFTGKKMLVLRK
ncbi:MAG: L-threonylcarbamoyladenylate synthase [Patescibacteria group bacterium]